MGMWWSRIMEWCRDGTIHVEELRETESFYLRRGGTDTPNYLVTFMASRRLQPRKVFGNQPRYQYGAQQEPLSLLDLCINTICRELLVIQLPARYPSELVDRILEQWVLRGALTSRVLRQLRECKPYKLDLSLAQNVKDSWMYELHPDALMDVMYLNLSGTAVSDQALMHFTGMPRLCWASFERCKHLSSKLITSLQDCKELQQLNLASCHGITNSAIFQLRFFPVLRQLNLSDCHFLSKSAFCHIAALPCLEDLVVSYCLNVTDKVAGLFSQMIHLRHLDISHCPISDQFLHMLVDPLNTPMESFNVQNCSQVTDKGIAELRVWSNLETFNGSHCKFISGPLPEWKGLTHLNLSYSGINDISAARMASLTRLKTLKLSSCVISDRCVPFFQNLCELTELDVSDTHMGDQAVLWISNRDRLENLNINYCRMGRDALFKLSRLTSLRVLYADVSFASDSSFEFLTAQNHLIHLDLFGARISDRCLRPISTLIHLQTLELCGGNITNYGVTALRVLLNLRVLNLSQNRRIDGKSAKILNTLHRLQILNLSNTSFPSSSLSQLQELHNLHHFYLSHCSLTRIEMKSCKTYWPQLQSLRCDLCATLDNLKNEIVIKLIDLYSQFSKPLLGSSSTDQTLSKSLLSKTYFLY